MSLYTFFPTVLEVWIFPCGRTPFQLPEDIDAQLSGVRRSSRNVGLASDSSQNQRDGIRRMSDQDCLDISEAFLKWRLFRWTLWSSVSKRGTQWAQISRYPKLPVISWTALCLIPSFVATASSVTRLSSLTISSTLFLLGPVEFVRGRPLRGWSWMLMFPF